MKHPIKERKVKALRRLKKLFKQWGGGIYEVEALMTHVNPIIDEI